MKPVFLILWPWKNLFPSRELVENAWARQIDQPIVAVLFIRWASSREREKEREGEVSVFDFHSQLNSTSLIRDKNYERNDLLTFEDSICPAMTPHYTSTSSINFRATHQFHRLRLNIVSYIASIQNGIIWWSIVHIPK